MMTCMLPAPAAAAAAAPRRSQFMSQLFRRDLRKYSDSAVSLYHYHKLYRSTKFEQNFHRQVVTKFSHISCYTP